MQGWGLGGGGGEVRGGGVMCVCVCGGGGGCQPLRTALHTISMSPTVSVERLSEHLIPAGRYLFIPFLRTRGQMGQTKNRSSKNRIKKDQQDKYNCYKLRLRAIKKMVY